MRRYLILILLAVCSFAAFAQQKRDTVLYLNKDSVATLYQLDMRWRFHGGDDTAMASPSYNDSNWLIVNPALWLTGDRKDGLDTFNSMGWFRLHVIVDSSIVNKPLALQITHYGASEIYLDGKLLKKWGKIKGKDSSEYIDPHNTPFIFTFDSVGRHIFAVRYANYDAQKNDKTYDRSLAAFQLKVGPADRVVAWRENQVIVNTFIFILLFGIFISLCFLHLFLFLYYRHEKSNIYFSVFCFSIGLLFLVSYLASFTQNASLEIHTLRYVILLIAIGCMSLSGLINELFSSRKKWRAIIIRILCVVAPILFFISSDIGGVAFLVLVPIVFLEAIILCIVAIYRKVKGAHIIGFGILFFTIFILVLMGLAMVGRGSFDDSTLIGQIVELILAAAILSIPGSMSVYLAWNFSRINKDLKIQLHEVEKLSQITLEQEQEKKRILEEQNVQLEKEVAQRTAELAKQHEELKSEKKKTDDLLHNILPEEIAEELKHKGISSARFFDHVTVLFTDFVAFTKAGERMSPQELVDELHACFEAFDNIISKYGIEKIKTIGDAYLAVCGLPMSDDNHAVNTARAALEIKQYMLDRRQQLGDKTFEVRIGIHSGSVVAGIVGVKKFAYDIWGDTVNTAARMEQNSQPGKVNISQTTFELVKEKFSCTYRGQITAKNKGELSMYFIEGEL